MAVDYVRTEETTTVVRYVARLPLDASTDVHLLLTHARRELNRQTDPGDPLIDRDPGYHDLWIEHLGDTGEESSRIAVCFRKVAVEDVGAPAAPEPPDDEPYVVDRVLLDLIQVELRNGANLDQRFPDPAQHQTQRLAYLDALDDVRDAITGRA